MSIIRRVLTIHKYIPRWFDAASHWNKTSQCNSHITKLISIQFRQFHHRLSGHHQKVSDETINSVKTHQHGVHLNYGDYKLQLPFIWLRDNCMCKQCYNHETFQKNVEANPLFPTSYPENVDFTNPVLTIKWHDNHITSYNIDWLIQNTYHEHHNNRVDRVLWDKVILEGQPLPVVNYNEYMNTDDGLKKHLTNLLQFGFSIISGTRPNHDGTLEVSRRICHIMETFYGPSWQFTTNMEFKDTAYTKLALGAHTDNTYFNSPSGIQVFHVVEHTGEGGQTLLVDGFHAAENIRRQYPDSFDILTKVVVPHQYFDEQRKMRSLGTILKLHPTTGELLSIRYNPYDIAPLYTLSADQINTFYESYNKLGNEIKNPEHEFWIKLKPDMVLFVDNWRVLHGRSAFTGSRHVSGCYLPYDDWTSIARAFGLINL